MMFVSQFDYIEERLNTLRCRIESRASLNLQDLNIHAEYFFMHFLNKLYGWNLRNLNSSKLNAPGVDLVYEDEKILIQVSSTATKQKIEESIKKIELDKYNGYTFKFLSITKNAKKLRDYKYESPSGITFDAADDILDIPSIIGEIRNLAEDKLNEIFELVKKSLSFDPPVATRIRAISIIIRMLASNEALGDYGKSFDTTDFEIAEKIRNNQLGDIESKISDLGVYIADVQKVYDEYDLSGRNKSRAVLYSLNNSYLKLKGNYTGPALMEMLANDIYDSLSGDEALKDFYEEDLRLYIDIILVDAFVRCKIFENPKRMHNDTT